MGIDLPKPDDRINPPPPDDAARAAKAAREALQSDSLGRATGDRKTISTGADTARGEAPKPPGDAPKPPAEASKAPTDPAKLPGDKGAGAPAPKPTDAAPPEPAKPASAESNRPVFFDPARGWYTKDAGNKDVPFNQGGKPVYDQEKKEWVKPFEASPPPAAPNKDQVRPNDVPIRPPEVPTRPPVEAYRPPAQDRAIEITSKADFDRLVLRAKGPVLVDFSIDGCPPCIGLAPKMDALAREFSGRAPVYRVMNADWAQDVYARTYPTTRVFDQGKMSAPIMGNAAESVYRNSLNNQLRMHPAEHPPVAPRPPQRLDQSFNPTPDAGTDRTQVPPDRLNRRPLEPYAISGFHSEAEREKFERWAHKKGFSNEAIAKAETMNQEEWNCFNSMNQYRASIHKRPLQFSPRVKLMSDQQAAYQASAGQTTHDSPGLLRNGLPPQVQRMQKIGLGRFAGGWTHEGENAAFVPPNCDTRGMTEGKFVTDQWLRSPGHLKPIEDDLLTIGAVSQQRSARTGNKYWTFNGSTGEGEKI